MLGTNLKVLAVVLGTVLLYTAIANVIPQIESDVPEELVFTGAVTVEELVAAGEQLYHGGGGCLACHGLGTRAPNLLTDESGLGAIGARCGRRVPGQDCKTYLHESLVNPNAYVVEGYPPIMPDASRTLSAAQIWALVAYLESLGGEVTVTADDIAAAQAPGGAASAPGGMAAAGGAVGLPTTSLDPRALLEAHQCLVCHAIGGEGGPLGPALDGVGARLGAERIRRAILFPASDTTPGYEALAGIMPAGFGEQMTAAQLEALVAHLAALR
jgi:mono/diheme cytochrome c family protein